MEIGDLLEVRGEYTGRGDQPKTLTELHKDVTTGCRDLVNWYFGTKDYSPFYDQGFLCEYGFVPKHGTSNWSIGLSSDLRKQLRDGRPLTDEQRELVLSYLESLAPSRAAATT